MQLGVYRSVAGTQVESTSTPFLTDPANDGFGLVDWLYSSQLELDRAGNVFGVIQAVDAMGYPAVVELVERSQVIVKGRGPTITGFDIAGKAYEPNQIWHERQFTVPGVPLGLSLISYAAYTIGQYLSAQQFGLDWFANGRIPAARLKNTAKTLDAKEAGIVKDRFKAAVESRDLFVHGQDWEYEMIAVGSGDSQFVDTMNFGILDIARFCGVPGDLIDAPTLSSAKITYANITQRNLQLLVMNLLPTLIRRERALSKALPRPRFVEFQPDSSLLRMDPQTRASVQAILVDGRLRTPDELRALDNLQPYTDNDYAQFDRLFGKTSSDSKPRQGVSQ
jgi:HK97 family phage portal protein